MASAVAPSTRTRWPGAHEQRRPGGRGRRRAAGAMSQRQVVQGRARGGRPDGWRRELGTAGRPLHRVSPCSIRAVPESPDPVRADGGRAGDQTPKHRDPAERG